MRPTVAHNTEFKHQQVQRLEAVLSGTTPPAFGDIDHSSETVYRRYASQPAAAVAAASLRTAEELAGALAAVPDEDLTDPLRNPWLAGRQLWLQIIVRGFWHPAGHVGEYTCSMTGPSAPSRCTPARSPPRGTWPLRRPHAAWPAMALAARRPVRACAMTPSARSGRPSA